MPRNSILTELGIWLQSNKRSRMKVFINFLTIFINTLYDDFFNYLNNPDKVLEIGTEVVEGNSYTYENYKWLIGQVEYNNTSNPITLNIISAQEGYKRKDVSYFLPDGTIGLKRGTETNGEVVETPSIPIGSLFFKYYDIEGSTVNSGNEPVLGVNYKVKVESAFTNIANTTVNLVIPIKPSGSNYYIIESDSVTNIRGFSKAQLILSRTSEWPYEGKDFYIKNGSSTEKNLIESYISVDIPLTLKGENLILKPGEVVGFKFFEDTMRILYITGNEADLSTKADLVGGKVPAAQLPSYVDDVLEYADLAAFPVTGETSKIYVALDNNKTYRWSGSAYVQIGGGANKQIFHWWGGTWTTTNLNQYYYISYNARAIETLPGGTGTTITASMTGRNQGLFIAPFNCKIRRVMLMDSGSGAYSGYFVIASGIPNYGGTWNITHYNIVTHLNTAISSPGYNKNKFEYLVSDNITVPKGYAVCPMVIFSSQAQAGKLLEMSIEIEEVV